MLRRCRTDVAESLEVGAESSIRNIPRTERVGDAALLRLAMMRVDYRSITPIRFVPLEPLCGHSVGAGIRSSFGLVRFRLRRLGEAHAGSSAVVRISEN